MSIEKSFVSQEELVLGEIKIDITRKLLSLDKREEFLLDIERCRINLSKIKFQNRAREVNILVRVDIGGSPHRNPDGKVINCPHIHFYREGFNDKWAYPLSQYTQFRNTDDIIELLEDFYDFCHIINLPPIQTSYA
jgi:MoaA/NifB/PqqE/SkfB family radical SAM enzyme